MAKTKKELAQLKVEYETLNNKLKELSDDELIMVTGGSVYFGCSYFGCGVYTECDLPQKNLNNSCCYSCRLCDPHGMDYLKKECPLSGIERYEQKYDTCIYKDTTGDCESCKHKSTYKVVSILPINHNDY